MTTERLHTNNISPATHKPTFEINKIKSCNKNETKNLMLCILETALDETEYDPFKG